MAVTQKRLAGPAQLTLTTAVYYTTPINTTTIVKQIILTNTTSSSRTVTVRLKPLNVAEAATHDIISGMTINANETMAFNCSLVLNNNGSTANATNSDQLTALCTTASAVNITIVGIEEA
jgi:hypothetical protein